MKYIVTICFIAIFPLNFFSQKLIINGSITPQIEGYLFYNFDETSGYKNIKNDTIRIVKGSFSLPLETNNQNNPIPIMFFIFNDGKLINNPRYLFVEPKNKNQLIKINEGNITINNSPKLINQEKIYRDYFLNYENKFDEFSKKSRLINSPSKDEVKDIIKQRNNLFSERDTLLLSFSKKNPNSYYILRELSSNLSFFGYKKIYEDTFKNLSPHLKNSLWGINMNNKLIEMKYFSKGFVFPIKDIKNEKLSLSQKYTLIDFCFSYCKPCLLEIPYYKELYEKYKDKNFSIISISTDRTQDIENWKKVIAKNNITWQNLLDENGNISKKYSINKFPTNFLLDSEGKIIKRDIPQEELEKFLEENLK